MRTYSDLIHRHAHLAGVLLHPTSLPSGNLDDDAFRWIDFMAEAGLRVWQVLPLGAPQQNHSPYQCYSAFAMNSALLSPNEYTHAKLEQPDFIKWCEQQEHWLDDYALFMTLKQVFDQDSWCEWPDEYKSRNTDSLQLFKQEYQAQVFGICWQQYCLYKRWYEIQDYAHERNIFLFGDMPIFVAHDSVDVWVHPKSFLLDADGHPTVVTGVPPDYFSETGQRWGNPHYNWDFMLENEFSWWLNRLKNHLDLFDLIRIDHFRGLEAAWVIPADCETAIEGEWQKVPGDKLLQHLQHDLGEIAIVAEDLGVITPEVNALREKFHLPGMSILQFSFDGFEDNPHKPKNITYDRVVYTGTHDNDTTLGWFNAQNPETQSHIMKILEITETNQVTDSLIDAALKSLGQLVNIPLQDLLKLGSEARMNIPGISDNNWTWKFQWEQIPQDLAIKTRQRIDNAGRLYKPETIQ